MEIDGDKLLLCSMNLLDCLTTMFEDPTYQSVFVMSAKHGIYYEGDGIEHEYMELYNLLNGEEESDDAKN